MKFAIETIKLTKYFKIVRGYRDILTRSAKKVIALEDINIQHKKGEIFCLIGPNGAGKTTLLKILGTLILPTYGSFYINGYNFQKNEQYIKNILGYITNEERSFYWRLTGRQNLQFFATLFNLSKNEANNRIASLLKLLNLTDQADRIFMTYSTGTKQKLAIARGLLSNPEILLMDEPTRSLDPSTAQKLRRFIKERIVSEWRKTVFLATHNLFEAEYLSDQLAIINKGKILVSGSVNKIKKYLSNKKKYCLRIKDDNSFTQNKLDHLKEMATLINLNKEDTGITIDIELSNECRISDVVRFLINQGVEIISFNPKEISLIEVFDNLIK